VPSFCGCADVPSFCEHAAHGSTVQATCPATCGLCTAPCTDDDAQMIAMANGAGYEISGCADVQPFCEHAALGSTVQATCPLTCGLCMAPARRLADGKDPNADELERIDELTVVASPTRALATGIRQKTEEFSNASTNLFYA